METGARIVDRLKNPRAVARLANPTLYSSNSR
jgi:hypothetical protein